MRYHLQSGASGNLLTLCLLMAVPPVSVFWPGASAQDFEDELVDMALFDLDELEGKERIKAINSLLKGLDEESIPVLCGVLRGDKDDDATRQKVLERLMKRGGPELYEPAAQMLEAPDQAVAARGALLLGRSRDKRALRTLVQACSSPTPGLPNTAIRALGELGDPRARSVLVTMYEKSEALRPEASLALVKIGHIPAIKWLFEVYEELTSDVEEFKRMEKWATHHLPPRRFRNEKKRTADRERLLERARSTFAQLPKEMTVAFVNLAADWGGRHIASFLAEQIPNLVRRDNAEHFQKLLDYDSPPLVMTLVEVLDGLGDPALRASVDQKMRSFAADPNTQRRILAIWNCRRFPTAERDEMLQRMLQDESRWTRLEAAKLLVHLPLASAAPLVRSRLAAERDAQLRHLYRVALWRIDQGKAAE